MCKHCAARVLADAACSLNRQHLAAVWSDSCAAAACLQRIPLLMWRSRTLSSFHQGPAGLQRYNRGRLLSRTREPLPPVSRTAVTSTCTWPSRVRFMAMCSTGGPILAPGGTPAAAAALACCLMSPPPGPGDHELATAGPVAARPARTCRHAAQHTSEQQLVPDGLMAPTPLMHPILCSL